MALHPHIQPAKSLVGFEHFARYWNSKFQCYAIKIKPGEFYITPHAEVLTTVLGSCVAACIRDPIVGVGGMNHFMLPKDERVTGAWLSDSARYGAYAMEQLINEILKFGGIRERLEVKITGGGNMMHTLHNIGELNIQFVTDYLHYEGLPVVAADVGGEQPRSVVYIPQQGRMLVKKLATLHNERLQSAEEKYRDQIVAEEISGDVELF